MDIQKAESKVLNTQDAVKVNNVPLPLLPNVVQLAISGLPNLTELINAGGAPQQSPNGILDSIQGVPAVA